MITKLLIIFLCITAATMVGFSLSKKCKQREKYFEEILLLINTLICDMKFRKDSLKILLSGFCAEKNNKLKVNILEYIDYIDSKKELNLSKGNLSVSEFENIKTFFTCLGTSDADTQIYELENYKQRFSDYYTLAKEKNTKYGGLYIKLGFLIGLAIGIILF